MERLRFIQIFTLAVMLAAGGSLAGCGDDDGGSDCAVGEYECDSGECISTTLLCDGYDDCSDGSDEDGCGCGAGDFECGSGECVSSSTVCDGNSDCADGSDEVGCCEDDCDAVGDTQCNGTVIETCAMGADDCLGWEAGDDCSDNAELCDDTAGAATCVVDCTNGPATPETPIPADIEIGVFANPSGVMLEWADAAGATSYDVYFGACPTPPFLSTVTLSETMAMGPENDGSTYCWQVISIDDDGCEAEGPVWTFETACVDPVAGAPTVTSGAIDFAAGTVDGTYILTFSEPVTGVVGSLVWTPTMGTAAMGTTVQIDPQTFHVPFTGAADGDQYVLTVPITVVDTCGTALAAVVDIDITIGAGCSEPVPTTCDEAHGYEGCCGGNIVYYWDGGVLHADDCTPSGSFCGWNATYNAYWCNATETGTDPAQTASCAMYCGGTNPYGGC